MLLLVNAILSPEVPEWHLFFFKRRDPGSYSCATLRATKETGYAGKWNVRGEAAAIG